MHRLALAALAPLQLSESLDDPLPGERALLVALEGEVGCFPGCVGQRLGAAVLEQMLAERRMSMSEITRASYSTWRAKIQVL
jgi:hypothetical protein